MRHLLAKLGNPKDAKCDNGLTLTRTWLAEHGLDVDASTQWLADHGAACDCEVLLNVVVSGPATLDRVI